MSAECRTGHLNVGISGAGHESKPDNSNIMQSELMKKPRWPFDNRLSEQEQPLVPRILGKILKQIVSLSCQAVSVEVNIDGAYNEKG